MNIIIFIVTNPWILDFGKLLLFEFLSLNEINVIIYFQQSQMHFSNHPMHLLSNEYYLYFRIVYSLHVCWSLNSYPNCINYILIKPLTAVETYLIWFIEHATHILRLLFSLCKYHHRHEYNMYSREKCSTWMLACVPI